MYRNVDILMRDVEGRKEEASKVNKAKQHSTPKAVTCTLHSNWSILNTVLSIG